jgi:hypothetical protein
VQIEKSIAVDPPGSGAARLNLDEALHQFARAIRLVKGLPVDESKVFKSVCEFPVFVLR